MASLESGEGLGNPIAIPSNEKHSRGEHSHSSSISITKIERGRCVDLSKKRDFFVEGVDTGKVRLAIDIQAIIDSGGLERLIIGR